MGQWQVPKQQILSKFYNCILSILMQIINDIITVIWQNVLKYEEH